jgi:BioD-like phosphotransacetylase family protein
MSNILIVASSEPRVGRSLIAAAIAYRLGRDGTPTTLARLAGDDSAAFDAATFAGLEGIVAPAGPVEESAVVALTGQVVLEVPAGSVKQAAASLGARVLTVANANGSPTDALPGTLAGTILTRVPAAEVQTVSERSAVLAVLAEDRLLAAPSVSDIRSALKARQLVGGESGSPIDLVMIGTVSSDAAGPYFGNRARTCVVTRFDKTDIQLAALNTDLQCLVLTGGGEPSPYLLDRVAGHRLDVSVLLAPGTTVESVRAIEGLFAVSRFEGRSKLARAVQLLDAADVQVVVG